MNVVILGAGVVGTHLAKILCSRDIDTTIIDRDKKRLGFIADRIDVRTIEGDVYNQGILKAAGCGQADLVLSVTNDDAINIITSSMAKHMGAKKVLARIRDRRLLEGWQEDYSDWFHIDQVLSPEKLTAQEIAKRIGTAGFYVPETLSDSNVALQEWTIRSETSLLNKDLREISEFNQIIIPAIFRNNEIVIPSGHDRLQLDDRVFMVGRRQDIKKVAKVLQSDINDRRMMMIFGGGEIGYTLAKTLESTRWSVKIIEPDEERCQFLSSQLHQTLVIHGSCLEEEFLLEQSIQNVDVFVATTKDEEDNLISSLVAKELGAKQSITLSDREEFVEIMKRLGIDATVSPKLITANTLLQVLDPGPFKSIIILRENYAEVIQVTITASAKITEFTLSEAGLPNNVIIAAIIRDGQAMVPRGDVQLKEHDIALIFTLTEHLDTLHKLFQ